MIVFNGDDFLFESLSSVYSFAHEILIVEGAVKRVWSIANKDGSSTDKTNEILKNFPDPDSKIKIKHGRWKDKTYMTNALLHEATGDYIWRLDSDEVYKQEDLKAIAKILRNRDEIAFVSIMAIEFFHGFNDVVKYADGRELYSYDRIWKFTPGAYFIGHRPARLYDPNTKKIMNDGIVLTGKELSLTNIFMYHYPYVTIKQVKDKLQFYYNLYLREFGIAFPLSKIFKRVPVFGKMLFSIRFLDNYRIRRSAEILNFNFINTVWNCWEKDKKRIEDEFGVSFNVKIKCVTEPFEGEHPKAIQDKIDKQQYSHPQ